MTEIYLIQRAVLAARGDYFRTPVDLSVHRPVCTSGELCHVCYECCVILRVIIASAASSLCRDGAKVNELLVLNYSLSSFAQ